MIAVLLARPVLLEHAVRFVEPVELVALFAPELFVGGKALFIEVVVVL
jgi:hypothetical protein